MHSKYGVLFVLIPSGKIKLLLKMIIYIEFSHWKWWFSIVMWQFTRGYILLHPSLLRATSCWLKEFVFRSAGCDCQAYPKLDCFLHRFLALCPPNSNPIILYHFYPFYVQKASQVISCFTIPSNCRYPLYAPHLAKFCLHTYLSNIFKITNPSVRVKSWCA